VKCANKFEKHTTRVLLSGLLALSVACGKTGSSDSQKNENSSDAMAEVIMLSDMTSAEVTKMSGVTMNVSMVRTGLSGDQKYKIIASLSGLGGAEDPSQKFSMYYCTGEGSSDSCSWKELSGYSFISQGKDTSSKVATAYLPEDLDLSGSKRAWVLTRFCDGTCQELILDFDKNDYAASKSGSDSDGSGSNYDLDAKSQELQTN